MYVNNGSRTIDHDDPDDPIRELMTTDNRTMYITMTMISGVVTPTVQMSNPFTYTYSSTPSSWISPPTYNVILPFDDFVRKVNAHLNLVMQVHNRADNETFTVKPEHFLELLYMFDETVFKGDLEWEITLISNKYDPNTLFFTIAELEAFYGSRTAFDIRTSRP